jgi:hypothetical protein
MWQSVTGPPNLGAGSLLNPTRHAITDNNLGQANGAHANKQAHATTSATTHLPADDSWLQVSLALLEENSCLAHTARMSAMHEQLFTCQQW